MKRNEFHHNVSVSARYRDRSYYQVQVINAAVNEFAARMKTLSSAEYLDALGDWKLADRNIDNLSLKSNDGLVDLVRRLAWNRIISHLSYLQEWIGINVDGAADLIGINPEPYVQVALQYRQGSELGGFQSILGNWHLAHLSGDGSFPRGPSATQAVVLAQERATYITRLINHNQQFVYDASYPFARIAPNNDGPYDIAPQRSKHDMALRRVEIKNVYQRDGSALAKAPMSVRTLLKEAFNLVPIFLGYQLQRSGYYDEALGYFRLVFDDRQTASEQRIDFGLELERSLPLDYDRADEFLRDTTNAHTIAATRKNSYTRQIVVLIVRCLIDHADALFTNDTAADNARARELYARAIELLDLGLLRPGHSSCANIIGQLEVELVESGQLPMQQFTLALRGITDPGRLRTVADGLAAANTQPASTTARLSEMRRLIVTALEEEPPPRTQAQIRQGARATMRTIENLCLAHRPTRARSQNILQRRRRVEIGRLAEATNIAEPEIARIELPWLRQRRPEPPPDTTDLMLVAVAVEPPRPLVVERMRAEAPLAALQGLHLAALVPATGVSFQFCIPQNPVIQALRRRAEANLFKLRTCRNIAGFVRPVDPYGAPIGVGAGMVSTDGRIFSGVIDAPPTIYRFAALIARAKELVTLAQQIEAGYQTALERAEQEASVDSAGRAECRADASPRHAAGLAHHSSAQRNGPCPPAAQQRGVARADLRRLDRSRQE